VRNPVFILRIPVILFLLTILVPLYPAAGQATNRSIKRVRVHDSSGKQVALYEKSCALLIGASAYTGGWPSLPGVKQD